MDLERDKRPGKKSYIRRLNNVGQVAPAEGGQLCLETGTARKECRDEAMTRSSVQSCSSRFPRPRRNSSLNCLQCPAHTLTTTSRTCELIYTEVCDPMEEASMEGANGKRTKWDSKGENGLMVCYGEQTKECRIYLEKNNTVQIKRNVIFLKNSKEIYHNTILEDEPEEREMSSQDVDIKLSEGESIASSFEGSDKGNVYESCTSEECNDD
ncbi:hypothetical protein EVAR_34633_1 [Eumeta japonica]|uniref:Retroviral polymerase SH3-like domain-containing protein n=1 Tax=Eumeta variegata TaxID=151549 RepID=A0A4C1VH35_EUMVA|nr:hypothetical protein EVAR_34633_1 [Eumeta japonica]